MDVHVVKRHAIVDVLCGPVVNVVIGVHVFVLSVPLVVVRVVPIFLAVIPYQFITLFHRSHLSHMFSLYSHGILGVVFTKSKRRNVRRIIAVWLGRKVVVSFHGMLLLSAKCPRSPGRRENSV